MDIIVEGVGKKFYTPDEVEINLDFYTRADSYESALESGTKNVEFFINDVLEKMNFNKEIMKTRSFRVYEEKQYDYDKKIYIKLGYAYTQQANIKFDYSMNTIAEFMDMVSKLENPPKYHLVFNVKDIKKCKDEVLAEAYNKAKDKAETIAKAAGKELKECVKTDFRPFEERVISRSSLNSQDMYMEKEMSIDGAKFGMAKRTGVQETIQTIFTPEDVEITETLYCLWITN
ncbi:MAG TPA: SIMPL domain-containing protein [Clostridiaceae bacterium]|nr:SIMPL domain-containing protein [Clostridiaceae bacterium]